MREEPLFRVELHVCRLRGPARSRAPQSATRFETSYAGFSPVVDRGNQARSVPCAGPGVGGCCSGMSVADHIFTLGIEEEFQIIDPETRELRSHIQQILADGKMILQDRVKPELHQSIVE